MDNQPSEIAGMKVFSNPEDLAASMNQQAEEPTPQPEVQPEPQVEAQPEPTPEPQAETQESPQVEALPQVEAEPVPQQETQEISESDYEQAVLSYMSERLGREFNSFDDFSTPQQKALDERIETIARFVEETGRSPQDWFAYQSLNPSEMDDTTAIRVSMASEYPSLSPDELNVLVNSKYKVDPDLNSEDEVRLAQIQLKVDAQNARQKIEELRSQYQAPEAQQSANVESIVDEAWVSKMSSEVDQMTGLEFDLGGDKSFTFGLDDSYKSQLKQKNARLDEYFDPYIREDGSWDYDSLSSHRAVVDNIDAIVASAYKQGLGDGQKTLVNKAANVQAQTPTETGVNQTNPLADQLRSLIGNQSNKLTFKI
jgi:hypothetical protein